MTYRPDSKDRKIMYVLARLGVEISEPTLQKLIYRIQQAGAKFEFKFLISESSGSVFSYELSERLNRLAEHGYIKRFYVMGRSYEELYIPVYEIAEKGISLLNRLGIAQRDKRVIDGIVDKFRSLIEKRLGRKIESKIGELKVSK